MSAHFTISVLACLYVLVLLGTVHTTSSALGLVNHKHSKTLFDYKSTSSTRIKRVAEGYEKVEEKPLTCQYSRTLATCDGDKEGPRHFTYIPRLPMRVTSLNYEFNRLAAIEDKSFFANVTQLTSLSLYHNEITWVSAGAFDLIPNLARLNLGSNPLASLFSLRNILATPSLSYVSASFCRFPSLQTGFLEDVDFPFVEELLLDNNDMEGPFNLSSLCRLEFLQNLSIHTNKITTIRTECVLWSLEKLDLSINHLGNMIPSCDPNGQSFFPKLKFLRMGQNNVREFNAKICLPKLQHLDLDNNLLGYNFKGDILFDAVNFPNLRYLSLYQISVLNINGLHKSMFQNSSVQFIDLNYNSLDFVIDVDNDTFSSCRNITTLLLGGNMFSSVNEERFLTLFGHLPLVRLSLRQTAFTAISLRVFSRFSQLESLDLCCNKIVYIPDGTFDNLVKLRYLDLSNNQIETIGQHTFSNGLRANLNDLCLHSNPFVCSCNLLWFRSWLRSRPDQFNFVGGVDEDRQFRCLGKYHCSDRTDNVSDFVMARQPCLMNQEVSGYIIIFCTTVTITLTTFLLLISYRWHLRLLLYEAFRGRNDGVRRQRLLQNNFDYDVFVSYAHKDLPWVRRHLMAELEGRLGLRLCIHERDFIAGNNIVDNIAESVERSKKVLMVFSKHFVLSQWCQFELVYCLRHVMDYDDMLIIVCVDDVASRDMTTSMMAVLKTTTYIQWAEFNDAIRAFWGRLRIALHEILDREQRV